MVKLTTPLPGPHPAQSGRLVRKSLTFCAALSAPHRFRHLISPGPEVPDTRTAVKIIRESQYYKRHSVNACRCGKTRCQDHYTETWELKIIKSSIRFQICIETRCVVILGVQLAPRADTRGECQGPYLEPCLCRIDVGFSARMRCCEMENINP